MPPSDDPELHPPSPPSPVAIKTTLQNRQQSKSAQNLAESAPKLPTHLNFTKPVSNLPRIPVPSYQPVPGLLASRCPPQNPSNITPPASKRSQSQNRQQSKFAQILAE